MSEKRWSFIEALKRKLKAKTQDEDVEASKAAAEAINEALPDELSARKAILEDRRRKKKLIDDMLRNADR